MGIRGKETKPRWESTQTPGLGTQPVIKDLSGMDLAQSSVPRATDQQATKQKLHIIPGFWAQHDLIRETELAPNIKISHFEAITACSKLLVEWLR